jgi:hypothetical protein
MGGAFFASVGRGWVDSQAVGREVVAAVWLWRRSIVAFLRQVVMGKNKYNDES